MDTFNIVYPLANTSSITDWISIIVDIITGGGIAFALSYLVPRKLDNDRKLKDYFIEEFRDIKEEYNTFCKEMCLGNLNAKTIKENFKQLNLKLYDIQNAANANLDIHISIITIMNDAQIMVTASREMNEHFNSDRVLFETITRNEIFQNQGLFNRNILSAIAAINRTVSKKRRY